MKNVLVFFSILSITFYACNKNHEDNSNSNTPTNPVRLSKVVDNSGRVVLEDVHGFDGTVNYTFTYSYYYVSPY